MTETIKPLWKTRLGQTISFSRDNKLLAVGGAHGPVRLLDAETGELVALCEGPKSDIYRIAFSHDRKLIAIGPFNRRVAFCEATTGRLVGNLRLGDSEIKNLEFSSKTGHLIRTEGGAEIAVFETDPPEARTPIKPDPDAHRVLTVLFYPDGKRLFAAWKTNSGKQEVTVTNVSWPGAKQIASAVLEVELVYDAAISGDGRFVAVSFSSYTPPQVGIVLLDAKTCTPTRTMLTNEICAVIFVPLRSLLIASDVEGDIEHCRLIDPQSGKEIGRFEVGNRRIFGFAVSADERYLAAATSGGAMVWDLQAMLSTFGLD